MGIFSKFKSGLKLGANALQGVVGKVVGREKLDEDDLLNLEEAFYQSDFGVETTEEIISSIREVHRAEKHFRARMQMVWPEKFLEEFSRDQKADYLKIRFQLRRSFV